MAGYGNVTSSVVTSDATLKTGAGYIHWITITNTHATDSTAVELEDTGTDKWAVVVEAVDFLLNPFHAVFDPPIKCEVGIFVDITGGTVLVSVGTS